MISALADYFHTDTLLFRVVAFIVAATLHDFVHAAAATLLKDRAARDAGRLSLNPLVHIDTLGLSMLLFGPYGWTKPVPVSTERRWRRVFIYLAAPVFNLLLGLFFWWLYFSVPMLSGNEVPASTLIFILRGIVQYCIIVNVMYGIVHLLPFYPLDGWGALRSVLPEAWQPRLQKLERFGLVIVVLLFISPMGQRLLAAIYQYAAQTVMNVFAMPMM